MPSQMVITVATGSLRCPRASCKIDRLELRLLFKLTEVGKDLARVVASPSKLQWLSALMLSRDALVLLGPSIGKMQSLKQLEICHIKMTPAETELMMQGFKSNKTIVQLHLDDHWLQPRDGWAFGDYQEQNTSFE